MPFISYSAICMHSLSCTIGIFFRAIPVETVAAGMAIDAYQYKSASSTATAANNTVIMSNADIYRIVQV